MSKIACKIPMDEVTSVQHLETYLEYAYNAVLRYNYQMNVKEGTLFKMTKDSVQIKLSHDLPTNKFFMHVWGQRPNHFDEIPISIVGSPQ